MRRGLTLIELLVVVAILFIIASIIFSGGSCNGSYDKSTEVTANYVCVKTYTVNLSESSSSKRVDLRPVTGGPVETFECNDSTWVGVNNSAQLYAQFEQGRKYQVTSRGERKVGYAGQFPLIIALLEIKE